MIDQDHTVSLNCADYSSPKKIRALYKALPFFRRQELKGNMSLLAIRLDLENALEILTPKQHALIKLCVIDGYPYADAEHEFNIDHSTISVNINSGLKRISKYLQDGGVNVGQYRRICSTY